MSKKNVFISRLLDPKEKILGMLEPYFQIKIGKPPFGEKECIREMKKVEGILVTMDCPITRKVMESTPKMKVISKYGAGVENIDLQVATELGIIVANSPMNFQSVAEGAVLMMLGSLRKITRVSEYVRSGERKDIALPQELLGHELLGKTVGIIGLGRIGSHLSKMLKCFEVRVLAFDPYVSKDKAAQAGSELVDLEVLLRTSDIITIHCQLTSDTRHIIREETLKLMKPTAILINTSRGGVIDEKALQIALEKGWIAGAGLDVFDPEPPDVNNPLLKLANVFAMPHMAGATVEARERNVVQAAKNLVEVLVHGRLPPRVCIANPKVLDVKMRIELT